MFYQSHNSNSGNYFQCIKYNDFFFVPHIHRHPELIYVEKGEVEVDFEDRTELVKENEYALIFSNCRHGYSTPYSSLVYVCIFSEDFVPAFSTAIRGTVPKSIRFKCRQSVTDFATKELFIDGNIPELFMLKSVLYAVLGEFLKVAQLQSVKNKNSEIIDRMIRYIADNYTKNITLETMATDLGYEKHYLSRCFNTKLKSGFSQYVNWYRIDHAKNLLVNTTLPISDIAFRSGFNTIRSFNRAFVDFVGTTPSKYLVQKSKINTSSKINL